MTKLVLRKSIFAEDQEGNPVLLSAGSLVSEITDAGPVMNSAGDATGWEVSVRVHHPGLADSDEIVTMAAIGLLKALE